MEHRSKSVEVVMEPTFYEILQTFVGQTNQAASAYIRNLIIADLRNRGLITESILASVVMR